MLFHRVFLTGSTFEMPIEFLSEHHLTSVLSHETRQYFYAFVLEINFAFVNLSIMTTRKNYTNKKPEEK